MYIERTPSKGEGREQDNIGLAKKVGSGFSIASFHAKAVNSSSCWDRHHQKSPTPWEHPAFLAGAQPGFVSTHIIPPPTHPPVPWDLWCSCGCLADKTPLVPSLSNKTFGNLEGHRDKRLDFFPFFSFFFNNKWCFVFTRRSFRTTPASKNKEWTESQGRGVLCSPAGNSPASRTHKRGRGRGAAYQEHPTGVI